MVYTSEVYSAPLLPFEKELIKTIGATEEEYRYLVTEAIKRGKVRPAGYEHIPDIQAGPGLAAWWAANWVGLAIGLSLTVAAYLLTPKPKPFRDERRKLDSINKAGRFTPTFGFDSQAELANFNDPIPIIFGKANYTSNDKHNDGGMLITPSMVWSRMFSYGTHQGIKYMMIVGEEGASNNGIEVPDLSGVFLGASPLDTIYERSFAWYWRRNTNPHDAHKGEGSRVQSTHLRKGSRGTGDSGDPDTTGEGDVVLRVPTSQGNKDPYGFSSARSLPNNAEFGCYAPIANGTVYRVNWRVIPWIRIKDATDDPKNIKQQTIEKIAGDWQWGRPGVEHSGDEIHRYAGMPGVGRNYPRRMGLVSHKQGNTKTELADNVLRKKITNVQLDDHVEFAINPSGQKMRDYSSRVTCDDINQEINTYRKQADDDLQIGEVFMIGNSLWQVFRRGLDDEQKIWTDENDKRQVIGLKCIDVGNGQIGLVGNDIVYPVSNTWRTDTTNPNTLGDGFISDSKEDKPVPGTAWFPLMKAARAIIKNSRACDTTEIGIKSRVYQQINGLCNFTSLLDPETLGDLWHDKVSVESGQISSFIPRASCFRILYRSATEPGGWANDREGWTDFGKIFVVIGSQNVDQYNQIRIRHPNKSRYEYQLSPMAGSVIGWCTSETEELYQLTNSSGEKNIDINNFKIKFKGRKITKGDIMSNKEFMTKPIQTDAVTTVVNKPSSISQDGYVTGKEDWDHISQIEAVSWQGDYGATSSGEVQGYGRHGAFTWQLFGNPTDDSTPVNGTKEGNFNFTTTPYNKGVRFKIKVKKIAMANATWLPAGVDHGWQIVGIWDDSDNLGITPSNGDVSRNKDWSVGNEFTITKATAGSNSFSQNAENGPLTAAGIKLKVTSITHVHDIYRGKEQGVLNEIFGSAESEQLHSSKTYELTMKHTGMADSWVSDLPAGRQVRVKFHGTVKNLMESGAHWTGLHRGWELNNIEVLTAHNDSTNSDNTWASGQIFSLWKDSVGGPFWRSAQGELGLTLKVDGIVDNIVTPPGLTSDRIFEHQSQYSDITLYGSLVQKSNDSSPEHQVAYVNEIVSNETMPDYVNLTTSVLALRASRAFSNVDQVRFWLKEGIKVQNLHPADGDSTAASNLFTDLIYYLFTNRRAGAGQVLAESNLDIEKLIDVDQLKTTSRFLRRKKLFFNGALSQPINLREYIADVAPYFLCDFVIADGRFSLKPALPVHNDGEIDGTNAVEIKQLFTGGNILEGSFKIDYLGAEERRDFRAIARYRLEKENQLPREMSKEVRRADAKSDDLPVETFDLTQFCTTESHAVLVAKYFLSLRKHITHTCTFKTTPYGLDLAPGDYIRVNTEASPFNAANSGTIDGSGNITSSRTIEDGSHTILYYKVDSDAEDVVEATVQVDNMSIADTSTFGDSIFVLKQTTASQNVYRVVQITFTDETTVEIVASEFPCTSELVSIMAQELISGDDFVDSSGTSL